MERFKHRWKRVPVAVRKPLIFIVGSSVVVTGILMLVLPGPGWAAIFLGFAILATEFTFAEKVRDWLIKELRRTLHRLTRWWRALIHTTKRKRK
jgi:uncharacterized protein (TIGR02611 family)